MTEGSRRNGKLISWIMRALAVAVGVPFFFVLLFTLVATHVAGSFLDPGFYTSALDDNDVYEFVLADFPTALLEDRRAVEEAKSGDSIEDTPLLESGLTTERIVEGLNRAIPPEWLQAAVERNIDEIGAYVTGRSDDFTLAIAADERADALIAELRALIDESDGYAILHELVLIPQIEEAAAGWAREGLPGGVEVSDERIAEAARAVFPPEWAREHGQRIFDEVAPYVKGEADEFVISLPLADRVDVAAAEVKDILAESPAYDLLYDEVIAPEITAYLGETVGGLPFGETVSSAEVVAALREAAPRSWVRAQVERLLDEATPYVAGRSGGFEFEVSLVENKRLAQGALTRFVERRIQERIDRLPVCRTPEQGLSPVLSGTPKLPTCIPPSRDRDKLLDELDVDIGAAVTRVVLDPVPDSVSFSHEELRDELADAGVERLDEARSLMADGWTYTQEDLRESLVAGGNDDVYDALQDARSFLAGGWTYTQDDFAEDVIEGEGADAMANIDRGRTAISAARTLRWLAFIPALILLVAVGLLGGRDWWGRLAWGAGALLVCAVGVAILSGLVYSALASPLIDEARWEAIGEIDPVDDYPSAGRLVAGKTFDVVESVSDTLAYGVATSSLLLAAVGAVVLAAVVNRQRIADLMRRAKHDGAPNDGPRPPSGAVATRPPQRTAGPWPAARRSAPPAPGPASGSVWGWPWPWASGSVPGRYPAARDC